MFCQAIAAEESIMSRDESEALRVYVGCDSRMESAWEVCRHSLRRRSTAPVVLLPLRLRELQREHYLTRPLDPAATTESGFSRFLVPALAGWKGWALYCDSDFLWLSDVGELLRLADPTRAVMCVKHRHIPVETSKMDGKVQDTYPRKNWSSLVLWNCGHPANRAVSVDAVNSASKQWLNSFAWLDDDEIGELPERWNWLEGWSVAPAADVPSAIHFTCGGPWFEQCGDVQFAALWRAELAHLCRGDAP